MVANMIDSKHSFDYKCKQGHTKLCISMLLNIFNHIWICVRKHEIKHWLKHLNIGVSMGVNMGENISVNKDVNFGLQK